MPVPSLKSMARRCCVRFVRNLDNIGHCPVELVESIINKIDNADQLRRLEENSPQVVGHTEEAWINLLRRDIPNFEARMPGPDWRETIFSVENADRWWRVYRKLKKEVEKEQHEADAKLAQLLGGIRKERDQQQSKVVNRPPPTVNMNRYRTAAYNFNKDMFSSRGASGQGFFDKLNRNAVTKASARMRTPTHKLKPTINGTPKRAPAALVEEARARKEREAKEAQLAQERERRAKSGPATRVPKGSLAQGSAPPLHAPGYDLTKDREARLRNLKHGKGTDPGRRQEIAKLTADFLEDDDDDDDDVDMSGQNDDLFGSSKPVPSAAVKKPSALPASPMPSAGVSSGRISPPRSSSPLKTAQKPVLKRHRESPSLFRSGR